MHALFFFYTVFSLPSFGLAVPAECSTFVSSSSAEIPYLSLIHIYILQLSELDGMSKQQENIPTADFVPVDLGVLVKDVATNMTVNARKASITLQYKVQPVTAVSYTHLDVYKRQRFH